MHNSKLKISETQEQWWYSKCNSVNTESVSSQPINIVCWAQSVVIYWAVSLVEPEQFATVMPHHMLLYKGKSERNVSYLLVHAVTS